MCALIANYELRVTPISFYQMRMIKLIKRRTSEEKSLGQNFWPIVSAVFLPFRFKPSHV